MIIKEEPKWYILHTYSGYEDLVKSSLEKLIENNNLGDQIFDLQIPTMKVSKERIKVIKEDGKPDREEKTIVIKDEKKIPCYVFIKMIYSNQLWYLITNTRGVTGFVGPQGRAVPMKKEEVIKMQLEEADDAMELAVGDSVFIRTDSADDYSAVIKELNDKTKTAVVTASIFDRKTDIKVSYSDIRKAD